MPRMSKKRKKELAFFLNDRGRRSYNELCRKCHLRWLCQLPLCGLAALKALRCNLSPSDKFSEIQLYFFNGITYNGASDESQFTGRFISLTN